MLKHGLKCEFCLKEEAVAMIMRKRTKIALWEGEEKQVFEESLYIGKKCLTNLSKHSFNIRTLSYEALTVLTED